MLLWAARSWRWCGFGRLLMTVFVPGDTWANCQLLQSESSVCVCVCVCVCFPLNSHKQNWAELNIKLQSNKSDFHCLLVFDKKPAMYQSWIIIGMKASQIKECAAEMWMFEKQKQNWSAETTSAVCCCKMCWKSINSTSPWSPSSR